MESQGQHYIQNLCKDLYNLSVVYKTLLSVGCRSLSQYRKLVQDASFAPSAKVCLRGVHIQSSALSCPDLDTQRDFELHERMCSLSRQTFRRVVEDDEALISVIDDLRRMRAEVLLDKRAGVYCTEGEWMRSLMGMGLDCGVVLAFSHPADLTLLKTVLVGNVEFLLSMQIRHHQREQFFFSCRVNRAEEEMIDIQGVHLLNTRRAFKDEDPGTRKLLLRLEDSPADLWLFADLQSCRDRSDGMQNASICYDEFSSPLNSEVVYFKVAIRMRNGGVRVLRMRVDVHLAPPNPCYTFNQPVEYVVSIGEVEEVM